MESRQLPDLARELWSTLFAWVRRPFSENPGTKIMSITLAVGVWSWVQGGQIVESPAWARVDYAWPQGLVLTEALAPQVQVIASGPRAYVKEIDEQEDRISVDMSEATAGVQSIEFVGREIAGLPEGVTVIGTSPSSVQVELVASVTRRLPLEPATVGSVAAGYHLAEVRLDPGIVEVTGSAAILDDLRSLHTDGIPIEGLRESHSLEVGVNLRPGRMLAVEEQRIRVELVIEADTDQLRVDGVPVILTHPGWRSELSEVSVILEGPIDEVRDLELDRVAVVVQMPEMIPPQQDSLLVGPAPADVRYEVLFPSQNLRVKEVLPESFQVERLD